VEKDSEWVVKEIVGDISKFSRYALVPNHPSGKDKIFRDSMGYAIEDAQELLHIYLPHVGKPGLKGVSYG